MTNKRKIGVGIVTYNRPRTLQKLIKSIPTGVVDEMVIVNDGTPNEVTKSSNCMNLGGRGVGFAKNACLRELYARGCTDFFLIEDDMYIKDPNVFDMYIHTAKDSGIHHLNFSQHGKANQTRQGVPDPKLAVSFNDTTVQFYENCVGAFSYYTLHYIEEVGLLDNKYYNAIEHIDHTYMGIQKNLHPNFWYFADISSSWEYIGDDGWSPEQSVIASANDQTKLFRAGLDVFETKHGINLLDIPKVSEDEALTTIKQNYKNKNENLYSYPTK
jgi:glycosyltransferase involved in cell wall biosynthesis